MTMPTNLTNSRLKSLFASSDRKTRLKKLLPVIILFGVIIFALSMIIRFVQSATSAGSNGSDSRVELKAARGKVTLNKTYGFPITDDKGREITKLKFLLDSAELRDEIILRGQKAVSLKGRTYLIVSLKLTNSTDKFININVRNYIRLNTSSNRDEWTAAEIYNDPVEVQPQSTKLTRLGFPISDTDKDIKIRAGDLNGEKETIPLNFK